MNRTSQWIVIHQPTSCLLKICFSFVSFTLKARAQAFMSMQQATRGVENVLDIEIRLEPRQSILGSFYILTIHVSN